MTIYFGLQFDEKVYRKIPEAEGGTHCFGPRNLLYMLESHLGLIGHQENNEHLRIEQYRQSLQLYLETQPEAFYAASFQADQMGAASRLLQMRDELLLAGYDFTVSAECPARLKVLCAIEELVRKKDFSIGFPERFRMVLNMLETRKLPVKRIVLNEPLELLPGHLRSLFKQLGHQGITIAENDYDLPQKDTDLVGFQNHLARQKQVGKKQLRNDGSLLIIRAARETVAATFLAKLFKNNPEFRPVCVIPEKNRALDNALIQEGLPSLGILSASLARPSLQILKLVTAFFWRPIDPYKIMEFVSLSVKPLADDLAEQIARLMAEKPGIYSDSWQFMIRTYFEGLRERAKKDKSIDVQNIEKQYKFWFERKRYDAGKTVPILEVIEVFTYLAKWAYNIFDEGSGKQSSMQVLSGQAGRIVELLEAQKENKKQLSHLELERIVRTIYEPSPVNFREAETGHFPFVYHSSAIIDQPESLLWWNFVRNEPDYFFSRWYQREILFLQKRNIQLQSPANENAVQLWQRPRSILKTRDRLILVVPEKVNGSQVYTHPLFDELEAAFTDLAPITLQVNQPDAYEAFQNWFELPYPVQLESRHLGKPKPVLKITSGVKLNQRESETFSSLDALFYYPYQWVFRYQIMLRKSSILSIVKEVTLMGNLAHRFFELLFQEEVTDWSKNEVEAWIDKNAYDLLSKEGAVLLLYGREPERIAFINRVKYAAWSLISMIQQNGWEVFRTEMELNGPFLNTKIKGKADLVLKRGHEYLVLDLKWRGTTRRTNTIRNEEDLQLVTYAKLLTEDDSWAHTAYFIIENGKLIARNNLAFADVVGVSPESDHIEVNKKIWQKMLLTYQWRMKQLSKGQIEVRTEQTAAELEELYADELMDLLEMRDKDAPFDDYRTLINLIE